MPKKIFIFFLILKNMTRGGCPVTTGRVHYGGFFNRMMYLSWIINNTWIETCTVWYILYKITYVHIVKFSIFWYTIKSIISCLSRYAGSLYGEQELASIIWSCWSTSETVEKERALDNTWNIINKAFMRHRQESLSISGTVTTTKNRILVALTFLPLLNWQS